MTRFARAKGSKSSNEKAPEDGTPWEVMKQQLLESKKQNEDAKKRDEVEKQRIENYENFLKEQKVAKRKATWCEFPEAKTGPKKSKVEKQNVDQNYQNSSATLENESKPEKKKKMKTKHIVPEALSQSVNISTNEENVSKVSKKKRKKSSENKSEDTPNDKPTQEKKIPINSHQEKKAKKKKKFDANGKPNRRKPINDNSFQLIINGKEVELVRFEGFPIMKKDADRLSELKGNMMKKGIPKSEVQRTMKLERRRAEKALARMKRDVCYNCRKGGHNLSDCPELKSKIPGVDAAEGVCFKCGSTEHRQFECKVQRDKEFRFANCFICKEQGHIARQCPDNPKGLYPNGGACKLCGDVTHLRKDCPTTNEKKESTSIKLPTLDSENVEDIPLGANPAAAAPATEKSKKPKKIKF